MAIHWHWRKIGCSCGWRNFDLYLRFHGSRTVSWSRNDVYFFSLLFFFSGLAISPAHPLCGKISNVISQMWEIRQGRKKRTTLWKYTVRLIEDVRAEVAAPRGNSHAEYWVIGFLVHPRGDSLSHRTAYRTASRRVIWFIINKNLVNINHLDAGKSRAAARRTRCGGGRKKCPYTAQYKSARY